MWLVDAAMSPELPVGWIRQEPTGFAGEYYYNAPSGVAQWEHPQTSFLTGVAMRLLRWREGNQHDEKRIMGRHTEARKTSSTGSALGRSDGSASPCTPSRKASSTGSAAGPPSPSRKATSTGSAAGHP